MFQIVFFLDVKSMVHGQIVSFLLLPNEWVDANKVSARHVTMNSTKSLAATYFYLAFLSCVVHDVPAYHFCCLVKF